MTDIFDGDPLITLDTDGADIIFPGNGQPITDTGNENQARLSQLTESGHWSEDLEPVADRRYTGELLKAIKLPITRDNLIKIDRAAELDAKDPVFGKVTTETTNPVGQQYLVTTLFEPVSSDPFVLRLTKNGQNWINQITDPADEKI